MIHDTIDMYCFCNIVCLVTLLIGYSTAMTTSRWGLNGRLHAAYFFESIYQVCRSLPLLLALPVSPLTARGLPLTPKPGLGFVVAPVFVDCAALGVVLAGTCAEALRTAGGELQLRATCWWALLRPRSAKLANITAPASSSVLISTGLASFSLRVEAQELLWTRNCTGSTCGFLPEVVPAIQPQVSKGWHVELHNMSLASSPSCSPGLHQRFSYSIFRVETETVKWFNPTGMVLQSTQTCPGSSGRIRSPKPLPRMVVTLTEGSISTHP